MSTSKTTKNGPIPLTFQPGKGYRKDVGKDQAANGRVRYRRFWLGREEGRAKELARLIVAEWRLIRLHGGQFWTPEALRRIEQAKRGTADLRMTGALAPVPPPVLAAPIPAPLPAVVPAVVPAPVLAAAATTAPTAPVGSSVSAIAGQTPRGDKLLYDAIAEFVAAAKMRAEAGQIAMGRWLNLSYSLDRLRRAVADRPLATIGFREIRAIVDHFTGRPKSPNNGRKLAANTVIDTLTFTRAFFSQLADAGEWLAPAPLEKLFRYNRKKLSTDAELDEQAEVKVFTLDELWELWSSCGNELQQALFLLGLNCGFTQTEIATLRAAHCHLDGPTPYVKRRRHKTRVVGCWRLWPETAALLRKAIARSSDPKRVFSNKAGNPLVHYVGRHRYDTVRSEWQKVLDRADNGFRLLSDMYEGLPPHHRPRGYRPPVKVRRLGFKHLRKTGSDLVRKAMDKDAAEVYLSHADRTMSRVYNNRDFNRLARALRKVRRKLESVLGPVEEAPRVGAT